MSDCLDYILDENNNPVPEPDAMKWIEWRRANRERARVAFDEVADVCVSTVFLGVGHRHFGEGAPILFETMVFGTGTSNFYDGQRRYSTRAEALKGHAELVAAMKARVTKRLGREAPYPYVPGATFRPRLQPAPGEPLFERVDDEPEEGCE